MAYKVGIVKDALLELLNAKNKTKKISIRPGEKLHEVLINKEEMRYTWKFDNMYMITNPMFDQSRIMKLYPGIKKIENMTEYSSDSVEKISHDQLKTLIQNSGLLK